MKKICIILSIISSLLFILLIFFLIKLFESPTTEDIYKKSQYNVVEVKAYNDSEFVSYGSAVLIDDIGTFITNAHVVSYEKSGIHKSFNYIEIRFSYEKEYRCVTIAKYDIDIDLAILKLENIDGLYLKPIEFGNSTKIKSGNTVYSIGNGMNHGIGISNGIVSIPLVNIEYNDTTKSVIQCDLVINDGNSGGALLDKRGRLIGITTFRIKDLSLNPIYGVAYCIPVNIIQDFLCD